MVEDRDLVSATGLALAAISGLIERSEPVPKGEVARVLLLLAETASPDNARQSDILKRWARLLETTRIANER